MEKIRMIKVIDKPTVIKSVGNKPKLIQEYVGRVNTKTETVSIAYMKSPGRWEEPGQKPEFDEYTLVLKGILQVKTRDTLLEIQAGQAVLVTKGEWVRYSTPHSEGAEYIAVCLPAFSPETVHRDQ